MHAAASHTLLKQKECTDSITGGRTSVLILLTRSQGCDVLIPILIQSCKKATWLTVLTNHCIRCTCSDARWCGYLNSQSHGSDSGVFKHVDMVRTTCSSSKRASKCLWTWHGCGARQTGLSISFFATILLFHLVYQRHHSYLGFLKETLMLCHGILQWPTSKILVNKVNRGVDFGQTSKFSAIVN